MTPAPPRRPAATGGAHDRWLYAWGVGSVAFGAASLLAPLYAVSLGADAFEMGALAAAAAFGGAPGAVLVGRFADRTGRRRSVLVGLLALTAAVLVGFPALDAVVAVMAATAALWFAVSAAGPVLTLLAVAGAPEREWTRRIGLLNAYQGYGWAAGLLLGTVWTAVGAHVLSPISAQRWLFVVCAGCVGVAGAGVAAWLPRDGDAASVSAATGRRVARRLTESRRLVRGATFPLAPNRLYWGTRSIRPTRFVERFSRPLAGYFLAAVLGFAGFQMFFAPLPLFLTDAGFGSSEVFGLYLISSVGSAVCYRSAGELSGRYDLRVLSAVPLGVRAVLFPAVGLAGGAVALGPLGAVAVGAAFALVGVTWAVIAVVATTVVSRLSPPTLRGEALGVYTALTAVAGGVGGLLGGWIAEFGYEVSFAAAGATVLAAAVVVVGLRRLSALTAPADAEPSGGTGGGGSRSGSGGGAESE